MTTLEIILSILPGLAICIFIYLMDAYDREPGWLLFISFLLGALVTLPAIEMEKFGMSLGLYESDHLGITFLYAYVVVAFSEEIVKFVGLRFWAYPQKSFDEPMDGIVHAIIIGMGFATVENLLYASLFDANTILLRAFTAVPAHASFAVVMGYFMGLSKFEEGAKKWRMKLQGLGLAVFMHGTYDFLLFQKEVEFLAIGSILGLGISVWYSFKLIRIHVENSPFKEEDYIL